MPRPAFLLCAAVLLFPALLTSCRETAKPEAVAPQSSEIRKETCKGPVCVRVVADKASLSIAEDLDLTIETEVAEGFEAELPRFGEKLGEFGIRNYREDPPQLTPNGKIVSGKIYTLEPFLSGDYTIAPMQARFRKKPETAAPGKIDAGDDRPWEHEITTEAITIRVNSLLEKDHQELALNPIKGPVGLPSKPFSFWVIMLGLGVAGVVAGGAFFLLKQRRAAHNPHPLPQPPAHELAYRQLQEIVAEGLVERGEIKLFFSRISDVLRGYIENRFGIHAPRRTTEEFLSDITRGAPFAAEHQALLGEFLRDCDLVKFAEHDPALEEITKAVDSCKAFIDATRVDRETRGRGDAAMG
jgi:hypothetical protein